jgi:cell division protease FtsH
MPRKEPAECSEETSRLIDAEVRRFLAEGQERVRETLTARRDTLEALAQLLMEKEVVGRDALTTILGTAKAA